MPAPPLGSLPAMVRATCFIRPRISGRGILSPMWKLGRGALAGWVAGCVAGCVALSRAAICQNAPLRPADIVKLPSSPPTARIVYGADPNQFADVRLPEGRG